MENAPSPTRTQPSPGTKVSVLDAAHLSDDLASEWAAIRSGNAALDSPFFDPRYTTKWAQHREGARVIVVEDRDEIRALLPFERRAGLGTPIAGRLTDYQGIVQRTGDVLNVGSMLGESGLSSWRFNHLVADQPSLQPYIRSTATSPFLDLSGGFDDYVQGRRAAGSNTIPSVLRKSRKLAREVGPLRLEWRVEDDAVFEPLMRWKSAQRQRTNASDPCDLPGVLPFLRNMTRTNEPGFRGVLTALYAGDQLVAAHLGLASERVLHCWFPAYDIDLGKFSPGLILMLELARAAADHGIERLDLGRGDERYKLSLASGSTDVGIGWATAGTSLGTAHAVGMGAYELARSGALREPLRGARRLFRAAARRTKRMH